MLQEIWTRCAKLIVNIPYLDNLWDKLKEIKDFETEICSKKVNIKKQGEEQETEKMKEEFK